MTAPKRKRRTKKKLTPQAKANIAMYATMADRWNAAVIAINVKLSGDELAVVKAYQAALGELLVEERDADPETVMDDAMQAAGYWFVHGLAAEGDPVARRIAMSKDQDVN